MSDSEQDKKRNKLGYQRISIACAHCRRRKIRCLLADKDPQGRCQNCIRLKKECVFYPIDQQGAYDSRSESSRRGVGSASSSGVSSTSPDMQSTHGQGTGRSHFPPFPHGSAQSFQGMDLGQGTALQGPYPTAGHPYQETLPSNAPWPPQVTRGYEMQIQGRTMSPMQSQQPQYWTYDQSPESGDFAPFPAQQVRTSSNTFPSTFGQQRNTEERWQLQQPHQPPRSMTFPLAGTAMATSLPQAVPAYDASLHIPSASYPPFSVPLESPHMMRQMQGQMLSTPIPSTHSLAEHTGGEPTDYQGPPQGAMAVQQGYPMTWGSSPGLGFPVGEENSIPSSAPPSQYVLPSQRPR